MTQKTIALFPEASYGAALNCVGIAQELRRQGARPVFICHPGFTGVFSEYGFQEHQLHATEGATASGTPDWTDFVRRHSDAFRASALDQIESYVAPTWDAIVDTAMRIEEPLRQLLARLKPDVIVVDNVITFPAVVNAAVPWVRVVSCAETEIPDAQIPPYLSGCPSLDRACWERFSERYKRVIGPIHERFAAFLKSCGLGPYPSGEFMERSPWLNLMLAPAILRYPRKNGLNPKTFVYLDGCVRTEAPCQLPHFASHADKALIYTSFGSLGAVDTELFERIIRVYAELPYRFLINVGHWRDHYAATPDNVFLDSWFPQPSVVRQAQLFVHHGGNNSFCEALYYGVPSLVMPYCWDGHDNAQRAVETGVGLHLPRYNWSDAELKAAIVALLGDHKMQARLQRNAVHMQAAQGTVLAAQSILKLATP